MAKKLPYFPFYVGDWLKDPELRLCSIFARGLLVDLLCLAWEAKHRGRLSFADITKPWSDVQIVNSIAGSTESEKLAALEELLSNGVLKRDVNGVVFSSWQIRHEELSIIRAENGSKGGSKTQATAKAKRKAKPKQNTENENDIEVSVPY